MGAWRVDQLYGVGVANVRLHAEPYLHPERLWSLLEGIDALRDDLHSGGRGLRRAMAALPAVLLGVMVVLSFALTVVRDRIDDSGVEVVLMTYALPLTEVALDSAPQPDPERSAPPEPPPAPKPVVKPPPRPEPLRLAEAMRRIEPPEPAPVRRGNRVRAPSPEPTRQPRVMIDSLASAPEPLPASSVRGRVPDRPVVRSAVDVRPLATPAPRMKNTAGREPRRFAALRPLQTSPKRSPRPALVAVHEIPAPSAAPASSGRAGRTDPAPPRRAAAARPDLRMASPSQSAPVPAAPAAETSRSGMAARRVTSNGRASDQPGLAGVPLGSLASCLSDREEDALKQRVVAAVTTQEQCVSRAGIYRFVETKNLNSFLLWVDRAPTRKQGDRCDELRLALECLASQ